MVKAVAVLLLRDGSMIKEVAAVLLPLRDGSMVKALAVLLLRDGSMIEEVMIEEVVAVLLLRDDSMTGAVHAHAAVLNTVFPRLEVVLRRGVYRMMAVEGAVPGMEVEGAVHSIEVGRAVISVKVEGVVDEVERAAPPAASAPAAAAAAASMIKTFHAASIQVDEA